MKIKNLSRNSYLLKGHKGSVLVGPGKEADVPDAVAKAHMMLYPRDFGISMVPQKGSEPSAEEIAKAQAALSNPPKAQLEAAKQAPAKTA